MGWTKQPAIEGKHGGCLNCGPKPYTFAPDMRIGVGFGMAALTRDGEYVAGEEPGQEWDELMTGAQAEALAAADPDHDWRITCTANCQDAPTSGTTRGCGCSSTRTKGLRRFGAGERQPSVLSGAAWWRDRLYVWAMFPVCFVMVGSYVAWRALTCLVDSWGDLRAGRVPAAVTVWGRGR